MPQIERQLPFTNHKSLFIGSIDKVWAVIFKKTWNIALSIFFATVTTGYIKLIWHPIIMSNSDDFKEKTRPKTIKPKDQDNVTMT